MIRETPEEHQESERPDPLSVDLWRLGSRILRVYGLDARDERLVDSFAVAVEATRRKLVKLGVTSIEAESRRLAAAREFVQVFAAAHDEAIRAALVSVSEDRRRALTLAVDRSAQPDVDADADWIWADPERWRFELPSHDHLTGLLLASRCACVVHFQNKGLEKNGFEAVCFAERLLELRDAARSDPTLTQSARALTPARWN